MPCRSLNVLIESTRADDEAPHITIDALGGLADPEDIGQNRNHRNDEQSGNSQEQPREQAALTAAATKSVTSEAIGYRGVQAVCHILNCLALRRAGNREIYRSSRPLESVDHESGPQTQPWPGRGKWDYQT